MANENRNPNNNTPANEPANTAASPINTAATNALDAIETPIAGAQPLIEHKVANAANPAKRTSFVGQLLDTSIVSRNDRNSVAVTVGLPDGSSKVLWTNPQMWSKFSDKFLIGEYVRVDIQNTIKDVTTYHNADTDQELFHNSTSENFNGLGRANSGMFNAQASANTNDLDLIMNAPADKADAVATYLGRFRAALINSK